MIALDTNVLVRYITQDDPRQTAAANVLIARECSVAEPGFVGLIALCELLWVLEDCYGYERAELSAVVARLLAAGDVMLEQEDLVGEALHKHEHGRADFADYLLGLTNARNGAAPTYTFDKEAGKDPLFRSL